MVPQRYGAFRRRSGPLGCLAWAAASFLAAGCAKSPPAGGAPGATGELPAIPALRDEPRTESLRAAILAAETSEEKAEAYQRLFTFAGHSRLPELEEDPDVGIALEASWEDHRIPRSGTGSRSGITAVPDEINQFIEAVHERAGVTPPESWKQALIHAHVSTSTGEHTTLGWEYESPGSQIRLPLSVGEVVAQPQAKGAYSYSIACGGRWTAQVWALGRTGAFTGWGPHEVILTADASRVYVFGWESHGAYLEAFDLSTGAPQFRFSTSYWYHWSEDWAFPDDQAVEHSNQSSKPRGKKKKQGP